MRTRLAAWLFVLLWAGLIFFLSAQPNLSTHTGSWDFVLRKLAHMSEYAILFLLLFRAFRLSGSRAGAATLAGVLLALAYAGSDEFHQLFVPGRSGELRDVGIDLAGALIAAAAVRLTRYGESSLNRA